MEQAAADQVINVDDIEHTVSRMREKKDKRALGEEDTTLLQLQQRAKDSDHILSALQSKLAAPLSEVDAFGSYIQATLGAMSKKKFRQARKAINAVLVPFLDNSSSDDELSSVSTLPDMSRHPPRRGIVRPAATRPAATATASTSSAGAW